MIACLAMNLLACNSKTIDRPNIIYFFTDQQHEGMMIVFDDYQEGEEYNPARIRSDAREIQGAWQLELRHMNGTDARMEMPSLQDLGLNPRTKGFAGTAVYSKTIVLEEDHFECIDLGDVQGIAELFVNGVSLGTRWYGD
ncbi:MAG: hypothetical protein GY790_17340 [Bacteroidetes bacterium]|nr:hypothetical protein [Bacteroidota bacterium]